MKIILSGGDKYKPHAEKLVDLMRRHAPHHNYHTTSVLSGDVWHFVAPFLSLELLLRSTRAVVSFPNIHFIRYPHIYSALERYIVHPITRESMRSAARLITSSPLSKGVIVDALHVEPSRVVVSPSIISHLLHMSESNSRELSNEELMQLRRRYELPHSFILSLGDLDTRHGQAALITTIVERDIPLDIVMVSRHTTHADEILAYARRVKIATRVHILYEVDERELRALCSLSMGVVYTPPEEASIKPVIEALRSGSAMILSSTRVNREVARGAAIYLESLSSDNIASALRALLYDISYRGQLSLQSSIEAERFCEESVAQELADIYESL